MSCRHLRAYPRRSHLTLAERLPQQVAQSRAEKAAAASPLPVAAAGGRPGGRGRISLSVERKLVPGPIKVVRKRSEFD